MKKPKRTHGTIAVPYQIKEEFRLLCLMHSLKPADEMKKIMRSWIAKEKKKNVPTILFP